MAELIHEITEGWSVADKEPVLITDNASNMIAVAQLVGFPRVKCYMHTLNLACQCALKLSAVYRLIG